jgi:hypothetical protein
MDTNVTSLVRSEPKIVEYRVQTCGRRFAMAAIANLRHAWTLFIIPLTVSLHARLAAILGVFAVLIPIQTRLVLIESYIPGRLSPRVAGKCGPALPRYGTESAFIL